MNRSYSKDEIVKEYKKLKAIIGHSPDSQTFYDKSPVSKRDAELAFGSKTYTKIQKAAGDEPRVFGHPSISPDEYFKQYGSAVREFQGIPKIADWKHRRFKPSITGYCKKFGLRWSQMPLEFLNWAALKPEWADVVDICRSALPAQTLDAAVAQDKIGYVYLMKSGSLYKIGWSESPKRREYEVDQKSPYPTKLIHEIETDDPAGVESYWHGRFRDKHKKGEFFELSPEDVTAFRRWKKIW